MLNCVAILCCLASYNCGMIPAIKFYRREQSRQISPAECKAPWDQSERQNRQMQSDSSVKQAARLRIMCRQNRDFF